MPGVVEQHAQPAPLCQRGAKGGIDRCCLTDIALQHQRAVMPVRHVALSVSALPPISPTW